MSPGRSTLATILQVCNRTHNLLQALTAAGGCHNPQCAGPERLNPVALDIQNGKQVSEAQIAEVGATFAEPGQPPGGGAEAGAGAEVLAGGVEALVDWSASSASWYSPSWSSSCVGRWSPPAARP